MERGQNPTFSRLNQDSLAAIKSQRVRTNRRVAYVQSHATLATLILILTSISDMMSP